MSGPKLSRAFTVTNPQGLHMRPLSAFVEAAARFRSDIFLCRGAEQRVNGKSILNLLGLGAEEGTQLMLEVCGEDAEQAMESLWEVLHRNYDDEESV
ncbi:MAG: HPr family phosphocarrier protein [Gemmataceae bacterium]|nr:HPr family phosphocarrier protein [Gemmataceae bacterium]